MGSSQMLTSATPGLTTGLMLIALMIMFIALCIWAWSAKQKPAFDQASRLPLAELDEQRSPTFDAAAKGADTAAREASHQTVIIKHLHSTH